MKMPNKNVITKLGFSLLSLSALISAYAGANMACSYIYHDPQKPEALKKLKKF